MAIFWFKTILAAYSSIVLSLFMLLSTETVTLCSKMDLGNKKGPVGRWDFDTPEEYSEYMSTREALPKAAFQYGKLPVFLIHV